MNHEDKRVAGHTVPTTDAEQARDTFTFLSACLPEFDVRLAKLQSVAKKLGVPPITYVEISREIREQADYLYTDDGNIELAIPLGTFSQVEYVTIRTQGESPVLAGGWTFLGAIEHTENGNLLHGDDKALAQFRTASADCVHCGYKRNRKKTVVCRNENGELAQIGTACVKDYLGYHGNPERLVMLVEMIRELRDMFDPDEDGESFRGSAGYEIGTTTDLFLTVVCSCVRLYGWTSKASAQERGGIATADLVRYVLGFSRLRSNDEDEELREMIRNASQVTDADSEEAQAVKAFALAIPPDTDNNYLGNVRIALSGSYVLPRHFGIAASAIAARRTDEEKRREQEEREGKRNASQHFGEIGKRLTLRVTVDFVRSFETDYGTKYLVSMTTEDGHIAKSFSTGEFGRTAEKGSDFTIKGTVKAHEEYKGTKQTDLTRVAIVTNHTAEASAPCGDPIAHAYWQCDCPDAIEMRSTTHHPRKRT